jgi:hypothetical protein
VIAQRWRQLKAVVRKIEADPNAKLYMDEALTPVAEEDSEHMELYTQNEAARVAVERENRVAGRGNGHAASDHVGNGHHHGNGHDAHDHHDHHGHDHDEPQPAVARLA